MDAKRSLLVTTIALAVVAAPLVRAQGPAASSQKPAPVAPAGDVVKGKALYEQTYRCYACHGFDGQSGSPRLVPMARTEDGFIAYLRKPSSAAMPTFADAPNADLVNVYAYIRSLRPEAPAIENIPLLKDILEQVKNTP